MEFMIKAQMKEMDIALPVEYMTWCGSIVNKIKLGFTYGEADVPKAVADTKVPVLIINSPVSYTHLFVTNPITLAPKESLMYFS